MKVNEAIEKLNRLSAEQYDSKDVQGFIEECDRKLYREIVQRFKGGEEYGAYEERYPLEGEDTLIAEDTYAMLYVWYALCQIYFLNAELERYTNAMIRYNQEYEEFKNYYGRTHRALGTVTRFITD